MALSDLPDGWTVWSEERERVVLAYHPDVFDTQAFPAPCLPTIYVTHGQRGRRPGRPTPTAETPWYVRLFLEPEVSGEERTFECREAALEGAGTLAEDFATGALAYRELYQVPREAYLAKLDELTGRE